VSELTHIASLFNKTVHENLASVLADYPWESDVAKALSNEFRNQFPSLSEPLLRSYLADKLISQEIQVFVDQVEAFRNVEDPSEISQITKSVFHYYMVRRAHAIISNTMEDVPLMLRKLREIPEVLSGTIKPQALGDMDPAKVREEDIGGEDGVIPTNFKIIKQSTPYNGYLPGQVVQWVAPPGVGKSAAMLYEVCGMTVAGFSVLWVALGDLVRYDFISRYTAVVTQVPFFDVAVKPEKYFNEEVKTVAKNLDIVTVPSKTISAQEVLEYLENCGKRYDVVVLDYDSNFKVQSDNMYEAGGEVYDVATQMARPQSQKARLVFIASQPKIHFWDKEELPEESAGESARKQHIIDMMITLGRSQSQHQCGIMAIPKVRRGTPNKKTPYQVTNYGHFKEITIQEHAMLKTFGGK
jgi:hypothetical protein